MSLPIMTGSAGTVAIGKRQFVATHFSCADIGQIQAWLKGKLPGPWAVLTDALSSLADLPPEERDACRKILVPAAHEDAKANIIALDSPRAQAMMTTVEGAALLVWLSIRTYSPSVTLEQLTAEIEALTPEQFNGVIASMNRIIEESVGTDGEEIQEPIVNPTTPPARSVNDPADTTDLRMANLIGSSSMPSSSKTRTGSRTKFPG